MTSDLYENEEVFPCSICGRNFIQQSLVKHEAACQKLQKLHRKVFDSGKQRAQGSDIPLSDVRKAQKEKNKNGGIFPRPKTHWRERHEEFISAVSASKNVKEALKTGAPLPPPPRASIPSDFVKCEYCKRNFNERAASRHIPFCREQHTRKTLVNTAGSRSRSSVLLRSRSLNRNTSQILKNSQGHDNANRNASNRDGVKESFLSSASKSTKYNCAHNPLNRFSLRDHATTKPPPSAASSTHQLSRKTEATPVYRTNRPALVRSRTNSISREVPNSTATETTMTLSKALVDAADRKNVDNVKKNANKPRTTIVKDQSSSRSRLKTPKQMSIRR